MKKIEKNNRKITSKNYYIVLVICILTIILTLYIRSFIINYKNNVKNVSIFENNVGVIKMNDLEYILPEADELIIYVSYTSDLEVSQMESKLYKEIKKKSLKEKVNYLNIDDYLNANEYIVLLKEKMPEVKEKINSAPMLIYVKDGKAVDVMSSELKMIDYKVFDKLVEDYEIK